MASSFRFESRRRPTHLISFAYYQGQAAVFSIDPVDLMAGSIPQKQRRLVEAWAEMHQDELIADWVLLHSGRSAAPIEPLK
jgi:hypothetical protein